MSIYEIIVLSVALALDAMVVSFSYGLVLLEQRLKNSLKLSGAFGFFQFIMPVIGWFLADWVYKYIKDYAKYIVFAVFIFLAVKFIKEAFSKENAVNKECISLLCLFTLAVATSIDALGAGISIRLLNTNIWFPALLIGIITSALSIFGFWFAVIFRRVNTSILKIIAGLLFVYLAVKALYY